RSCGGKDRRNAAWGSRWPASSQPKASPEDLFWPADGRGKLVTENRRNRLAVNPPSMFMPKGYSHGVSVEGNCIVFDSGQSVRNSDGSLLSDIVAQTSQALKNVRTT